MIARTCVIDILGIAVDGHLADESAGEGGLLIAVSRGLEPGRTVSGRCNGERTRAYLSKRSRTLSWSTLISRVTSR